MKLSTSLLESPLTSPHESTTGSGSERVATDGQQIAFERMLEGHGLGFKNYLRLGWVALGDPFRLLLSHMPGPLGYALRQQIIGKRLGAFGKNSLLDVGLKINGPKNISVGEYTWIDSYTALHSLFGPIRIGKRIHISPYCSLTAGPEGIELEDYVGLSTGVHIYGHTQAPVNGLRMSGPMIPWRYKACRSGRVHIERDAFLGVRSIVFPGVTIGRGAVIGAGAIVTKDIPAWSIVVGAPAKTVGKREPVTVPEL